MTVENGTIVAGANSYVTVSDADTYHTDHGNTTWSGTDADKEVALIRASQFIDGHFNFQGIRQSYMQSMMWPRYEVFDDIGVWVTGIPQRLKDAVCEAALRSLTGTTLEPDQDRGGHVQSQTVGPITTTYQPGAPAGTIYKQIANLLKMYLRGGTKIVRV